MSVPVSLVFTVNFNAGSFLEEFPFFLGNLNAGVRDIARLYPRWQDSDSGGGCSLV